MRQKEGGRSERECACVCVWGGGRWGGGGLWELNQGPVLYRTLGKYKRKGGDKRTKEREEKTPTRSGFSRPTWVAKSVNEEEKSR